MPKFCSINSLGVQKSCLEKDLSRARKQYPRESIASLRDNKIALDAKNVKKEVAKNGQWSSDAKKSASFFS